jgi:hypothetical protein
MVVLENPLSLSFQIKDNIEQIFTKFVNEGKATIRLKHPEQDLCLCKVCALQLELLLVVHVQDRSYSIWNMYLQDNVTSGVPYV